MNFTLRVLLLPGLFLSSLCLPARSSAAEPTPEQIEFFEKQVRPVLAENCFGCHGPKQQKAGLRLDSRAAMLRGGELGPAMMAGKPDESRLITAIHYDEFGLQMPPNGKLPAAQIAALTRWVEMGAPWPGGNDAPAAAPQVREFNLAERKQWWSFQPVTRPEVPNVRDQNWPRSPIDNFILARLESEGLTPAPQADRRALLRRVTFDLTGLPPTPAEIHDFLNDDSPEAFTRVVDRLLASPHYGERWARHWLDLVRYAESRGHEFDYEAPNVHHYRDYVIRALNADVPYDQFVTEHIAGDLLPEPRMNPQTGGNESVLGTGFWYLGEWVHSPVDIRQDEADRFDNMVDVFSKTFLGLTVACARCHDHKFDPITTKDYYALFGYLQSTSYCQTRFETEHHNRRIAEQLEEFRSTHRPALQAAVARAMQPTAGQLANYLLAAREVLQTDIPRRTPAREVVFADFEDGTYGDWKTTGTAFGQSPVTQQTVAGYQGKINALGRFFVNSHNVREKIDGKQGDAHTGTLTSAPFTIEQPYIAFRVGGGAHKGKTCVNLLIDDKVVLSTTGRNNNRMAAAHWDVRPFKGKTARIQIVDQITGGWGNIGVDHIVFTDSLPGTEAAVRPTDFAAAFRKVIDEIAARSQLDAGLLAAWVAHLINVTDDTDDPLHAWAVLAQADPDEKSSQAQQLAAVAGTLRTAVERSTQFRSTLQKGLESSDVILDFRQAEPSPLMQNGVTFGVRPTRPGDVRLSDDPARPIARIVDSHAARRDPVWNGLKLAPGTLRDSGKLGGTIRAGRTLRTPTFEITGGRVFCLVRGSGHSYAAVDSHILLHGPLHGKLVAEFTDADPQNLRWEEHRLSDYTGHRAHLEFIPKGDEDFAVLMVVQSETPPPAIVTGPAGPLAGTLLAAIDQTGEESDSPQRIATALQTVFQDAWQRLNEDRLTAEAGASDGEASAWASLTDWMVQHPQLFYSADSPQGIRLAEETKPILKARTQLLAKIRPESSSAPTMMDGSPESEYVFIRGRHNLRGDVVPRRFLEAFGGKQPPQPESGSGRRQLAAEIVSPENPLTARVIVNRLWHHHFGRGIVATTDDFGQMGERPTHPELLDWLATELVRQNWSLKQMHRTMLLSATWQMSSRPVDPQVAEQLDPENRLLHRQNRRRLEGEIIRDAILAVSGRLDRTLGGPPVPVHLTSFMEGRGRPRTSGPVDGHGRRSIYLSVRRNFLAPFFLAFDFPQPHTTIGRRSVSNVPAQALALMNNPFISEQASVWATRLLEQSDLTTDQRITLMYESAFARLPSLAELAAAQEFLRTQQQFYGEGEVNRKRAWADLGHVLWNVKEFVFIN